MSHKSELRDDARSEMRWHVAKFWKEIGYCHGVGIDGPEFDALTTALDAFDATLPARESYHPISPFDEGCKAGQDALAIAIKFDIADAEGAS